jgi:uncharacterized membrane protein
VTASHIGILVGAVLALTWVVIGFWAFLFVAVAMAVGLLVGRIVDGKLDVHSLVDALKGTRSSS